MTGVGVEPALVAGSVGVVGGPTRRARHRRRWPGPERAATNPDDAGKAWM